MRMARTWEVRDLSGRQVGASNLGLRGLFEVEYEVFGKS